MKLRKLIGGLAIAMMSICTLGGVLAIHSFNKEPVSVSAAYSQGSVIANDKARIWIGYDSGNPFYSYADANTGIRLWIHSTSSGGSEKVYGTISGTFNNVAESNRRYDYFDVDLSVYTSKWYMTVQKFQNGNWKASTDPIQLQASNACQVYWVWGDWGWDKTQGTVATGSIDSVDAGLAAKALAGLHNCSSSSINGYNAFANYNSTFVKNGDTWRTVGNISDYELTDFASGNTSYSGSPNLTVNAYEKYEYIQNMYNNGGVYSARISILGDAKNTNNSTPVIIIVSTLVAVSAVGGYFLLRKRKEQ